MKAQKNTKIMVTCALLVALQVILARFLSINTTFVVINFSFLAVALSGILLRAFPLSPPPKGTGAELVAPRRFLLQEASPVLRCQGRPAVSLPRCCRRDAPRDKAGDQAQTQQQRGHGGHHAITHEYPPCPLMLFWGQYNRRS